MDQPFADGLGAAAMAKRDVLESHALVEFRQHLRFLLRLPGFAMVDGVIIPTFLSWFMPQFPCCQVRGADDVRPVQDAAALLRLAGFRVHASGKHFDNSYGLGFIHCFFLAASYAAYRTISSSAS